ncbi:MAG: aryl-sulfate sulfotransferase [Flavobacteriales bacterium]
MKTFFFFFSLFFVSEMIAQTNTIGTIKNTPESLDGYTLFAPLNGYKTYLIDNCGQKVHEWSHVAESRLTVELLEDGTLIRSAEGDGAHANWTVGGSAGRIEKVDWNSNVTWSFEYISATPSDSGQYNTHHDFEVLPNGNILILVWENRPQSDVISQGVNTDYDDDFMWMEKIIEIEPTGTSGGNIVWEWFLYDHIIQDFDASKPNYGNVSANPNKIDINYKKSLNFHPDWIHINSIDYNADLDQILLTANKAHEIWILDHSTTTAEAKTGTGGTRGKGGDILYRWGNPYAYKVGDPDDRILTQPHHAEWIPNGYRDAGKIMLYNNGDFWDEIPSRITMFEPAMDAAGNYTMPTPGNAFLPNAPFWQYFMNLDVVQPDFISDILSGVYRLENGNTLICNGAIHGYFIELDSNDNVVWEYFSPAGAHNDHGSFLTQGDEWATGLDFRTDVFRAIKYKPNYLGFTGQDLTPGSPLELNPNANACTLYPDTTLEPINIEEWKSNIEINNPINNLLIIKSDLDYSFKAHVYNLQGQLIYESIIHPDGFTINSSGWHSGLYILELTNSKNQKMRKKIIKQ